MKYAIEILQKEKDLISDALSKWEMEYYPEAKKVRVDRLKQLNRAIEVIVRHEARTLKDDEQ
jgi:ribosomal protein L15E